MSAWVLDLECANRALSSQIDNLREDLASEARMRDAAAEEYMRQIEDLRETAGDLRCQRDPARASAREAREADLCKIEHLNAENYDLNLKISDLEDQVEALRNGANDREWLLADAERKLRAQESVSAERLADIEHLEIALEQERATVSQIKAAREYIWPLVWRPRCANREPSSQIEGLRDAYDAALRQIERRTVENYDLTCEISDLKVQIEDLRNEVTYARDEYDRTLSKLEATRNAANAWEGKLRALEPISTARLAEIRRLGTALEQERAKTIADRLEAIFGPVERIEVCGEDTVLGPSGAYQAAQEQGFALARRDYTRGTSAAWDARGCTYILRRLRTVNLGA